MTKKTIQAAKAGRHDRAVTLEPARAKKDFDPRDLVTGQVALELGCGTLWWNAPSRRRIVEALVAYRDEAITMLVAEGFPGLPGWYYRGRDGSWQSVTKQNFADIDDSITLYLWPYLGDMASLRGTAAACRMIQETTWAIAASADGSEPHEFEAHLLWLVSLYPQFRDCFYEIGTLADDAIEIHEQRKRGGHSAATESDAAMDRRETHRLLQSLAEETWRIQPAAGITEVAEEIRLKSGTSLSTSRIRRIIKKPERDAERTGKKPRR